LASRRRNRKIADLTRVVDTRFELQGEVAGPPAVRSPRRQWGAPRPAPGPGAPGAGWRRRGNCQATSWPGRRSC